MSSIIVYGDSKRKQIVITRETQPNPSNFYGDSKLQAEFGIGRLECESFKVVMLRPPMIYGKGSKGNYQRLSKFAQKAPIFPDFKNQRSMLHIDNLTEFLRLVIIHEESGLFFPQNKEYVSTSELVKEIAKAHNKRIKMTKVFNPIISIFYSVSIFNKMFGSLVYKNDISHSTTDYQIVSFSSSIKKTEIFDEDFNK